MIPRECTRPGVRDAPLAGPARDWWKKAETRAELPPERGRGWHSLTRKFASDLWTCR